MALDSSDYLTQEIIQVRIGPQSPNLSSALGRSQPNPTASSVSVTLEPLPLSTRASVYEVLLLMANWFVVGPLRNTMTLLAMKGIVCPLSFNPGS